MGINSTLAALLWIVFEKLMRWHDESIAEHAIYTNFFSVVAIVVYVLVLLDNCKNFYNGLMNWKEGFICGLLISLGIAILAPISQNITHVFITPEYFPNVINYAVESGNASEKEAQAYFL